MLKLAVGVLGVAFVMAPAAVAQQGIDAVLFEQGQQLYQENCALCHQNSGVGDPPTFPALSGNDRLGDPARIVRSIRWRSDACWVVRRVSLGNSRRLS